MKNKKQLKSVELLKENQEKILEIWQKDVQINPQFKDLTFNKKNELITNSKTLFTNMIDPKITKEVEKIQTQSLKPVLKLWHHMLSEQAKTGFNTKDSTILLLSLKASIQKFLKDQFKDQEYEYNKEFDKINNLLDILGILTFEMYTIENEQNYLKKTNTFRI